MKKQILSIAAFALLTVSLVFTGCKKDDTTAPDVTLVGNASQTISLQGSYTESGATANDNEDGAMTPSISGSVNTNQTGTYTITYTATDAAGNAGTATRTVTVVNDVASMTGTYQCTISVPSFWQYTQTITASQTVNRRIHFGKFGDYDGNVNIYADVVGASITLPSQLAIQVGTPPADRTFAGTGAVNSTTTFGLNYTETITTSINTVETFVKQ